MFHDWQIFVLETAWKMYKCWIFKCLAVSVSARSGMFETGPGLCMKHGCLICCQCLEHPYILNMIQVLLQGFFEKYPAGQIGKEVFRLFHA